MSFKYLIGYIDGNKIFIYRNETKDGLLKSIKIFKTEQLATDYLNRLDSREYNRFIIKTDNTDIFKEF